MIYAAGLLLALQLPAVQQGSGLSFQVPNGWEQATDPSTGAVSLVPRNLPILRACKVTILPPQQYGGTAEQYHDVLVARGMRNGRLLEPARAGSSGRFRFTRLHQVTPNGEQAWTTIYSARWSDRGQVIVFVATAGDIERRYLPAVDTMVSHISLPQTVAGSDQQPSAPIAPPPAGAAPNSRQPTVPAAGGGLSDYVFTAPKGWTTMSAPDGILLKSPAAEGGETCVIALSPMTRSNGDPLTDANGAWSQLFAKFGVPDMGSTILSRGVSPQGWEYAVVRRGIARRGSIDPMPELFAMTLVAKLGDRIATISWFSRGPLYASCFVDKRPSDLPEVWPRFFASLQFRNWSGAPGSGLAQRVPGVWESIGTSTGGGAALQYTFTPAKRYAFMGVGQRYMSLSEYTAAVWTSTTFGDGSYVLRGNELTLAPDRDKPEVWLIRLEQVSEDGGKTWTEKLFMTRPLKSCNMNGCADHDAEIGLGRRSQ
jgi:hypothetical protein